MKTASRAAILILVFVVLALYGWQAHKESAKWVDTISGGLTLVIAALAVQIAWQQWKTNDQRLKLELYDRRFHVFEELRQVLGIITSQANINVDDLVNFRREVLQADFLFGPEIPDYLRKVHEHGLNLWELQQRLIKLQETSGTSSDEKSDEAAKNEREKQKKQTIAEITREIKWLGDQFDPAKAKFKKYLNLTE